MHRSVREAELDGPPRLLLEGVGREPWSAGLFVSRSMDALSLTTAPNRRELARHAAILLEPTEAGVRMTLRRPGYVSPIAHHLVSHGAALAVLVDRLRELEGLPPGWLPLRPETDAGEVPRWPLGSEVRVLLNHRNRTAREGVVAEVVWHHVHGCWVYWLDVGGRLPLKW